MSELKITNNDGNITLDYDQTVCPYHRVIADLVTKHALGNQTSILDLGCGVGNTLLEIQRRDDRFKFTIADVDEQCLEITQQRVDRDCDKIHLESAADVQRIDRQFDVVLLSHVLHYDPQPRRTIAKIFSMLRPDGFLAVSYTHLTLPMTPYV